MVVAIVSRLVPKVQFRLLTARPNCFPITSAMGSVHASETVRWMPLQSKSVKPMSMMKSQSMNI